MDGWIKLHRQIQDNVIWQEKPFHKALAWIDLLLLANHKDKKILIDNEVVVIERGQFHTSILKLADRWGWNRKTVSSFLNLLENEEMITQKRTARGTTLTVVNYGFYQNDGTTDGTPERTPEGTTPGQPNGQLWDSQTDINKNIKNYKNDKNEKNEKNDIPPLSPQGDKKKHTQKTMIEILKARNFSAPVEDILEQWLKYKVEKRQSYGETGLNQLLNKIERLANQYGDAKVVEVISATMAANYQGIVYEWFNNEPRQSVKKESGNFYDRLRKAVGEC